MKQSLAPEIGRSCVKSLRIYVCTRALRFPSTRRLLLPLSLYAGIFSVHKNTGGTCLYYVVDNVGLEIHESLSFEFFFRLEWNNLGFGMYFFV